MWVKTAVVKTHQYQALPEHWVRESGNFLKSLDLSWYNSWLDVPGEHSWQEFIDGCTASLGAPYLALSIACMWGNLNKEGSIKQYIKAHKKIANYQTINSRWTNVLFFMPLYKTSNQVWPSSFATKIAKPLKTTPGSF